MGSLFPAFNFKILLGFHILVSYVCYNPTNSGAVQLNSQNIDTILATNELVFINFYADWCRFSSLLAPVFDEAADKVHGEFKEPGQVVLGKVDCDSESSIATRFHITKYPTLKLMRNGQPAKKEYRGQRSADAFFEFIKNQLVDPIKEFKDLSELNNLETNKRIMIGYFERRDVPEYSNFRRVASNMKDECQFHVGFGDASRTMHPPGTPIIVYRADKSRSSDVDETFRGNLNSYDEVNVWVSERCVPLVREITFENAEELTEEGLPFLILFHKPGDTDTIKRYNDVVVRELLSEKQNINFLTADGVKFAHPLHHLGKGQGDLPLLAIDSFRHMYLFPDIKEMEVPGRLKAFLQDLYSGKLHREFHYGPETPTEGRKVVTSPPESTFKKLAPSPNRYTLLKDEL